jgi:hypothetical protein
MTKSLLIIFALLFAFVGSASGQQKPENQLYKAEANKPENQLYRAYEKYVTIKLCYENRKWFENVYINDFQMSQAKQYAAAIEQELSIANKDEIWTKANNSIVVEVEMQLTYPRHCGSNREFLLFNFVK